MSGEPQLFRVDLKKNKQPKRVKEVEFSSLGLKEREHIQEWIADHPDFLGEDLLIISKEFSRFDVTKERLDLLAVDKEGRLVIIELKRDDSGTDAHWQAIKYASYFHAAKEEDIIGIFAKYRKDGSPEDAASELERHLGADDLSGLNNAQRIILVSHRFAPEVTSAALWLNEQARGRVLITCVTLTPYQDPDTESVYIHASTVIPVPVEEDLKVKIAETLREEHLVTDGSSTFGDRMRETKARHSNDDITRFLRRVADIVREKLPEDKRPDRQSRAAGDGGGPRTGRRQYHLWYRDEPWGNWKLSYSTFLYDKNEEAEHPWRAEVGVLYWANKSKSVEDRLRGIKVFDDQEFGESNDKRVFVTRYGKSLDEPFAQELAETICQFVEGITPSINLIGEDENEEDAG